MLIMQKETWLSPADRQNDLAITILRNSPEYYAQELPNTILLLINGLVKRIERSAINNNLATD